jgi:hypothetical protein
MGNTNLKEFFDFNHRKLPYEGYTSKMVKNVVFPESGLRKHFYVSKICAIDSPNRKILVRSKISSKIDFYSQISTF